jgi:hypothetical protein
MAVLTPIDLTPLEAPVESPGIAPETTSPMKPSEGIRLGAMTTVQGKGRLSGANQYSRWTCAIGAARMAMGGPEGEKAYEWFNSLFADGEYYECPVTYNDEGARCYVAHRISRPSEIVVHLNDYHDLPREWIADFIESIGY